MTRWIALVSLALVVALALLRPWGDEGAPDEASRGAPSSGAGAPVLEGRPPSEDATPTASTGSGRAAARPPREVTGRLLDGQGRPVAGAQVAFWVFVARTPGGRPDPDVQPREVLRRTARSDGSYALSLAAARDGFVEATAPGHRPVRRRVTPWEQGPLRWDATLARAPGRLAGRLTREDGGGVGGALAWLVYGGGESALELDRHLQGPRAVEADARGRFAIHGVPLSRRVLVKARAPDGATGTTNLVVLRPDRPERSALVVALRARGAIRGRMLAHDGRPLAAGRLYWHRRDVHAGSRSPCEASPDHEGRFHLRDLEAGVYDLVYLHENVLWRAPAVAVAPGETTDLGERRHGTAGVVAGRVAWRDGQGDPEDLYGLRLKLFRGVEQHWARALEGGAFRFGHLGRGRYRLEVDTEAYRLAAPLEVETGREGLVLDVVGPSACLATEVRDPAGQALPGARLWVADHGPPGSPVRVHARTGPDGRHEADDLPPGAYDVMVEYEGLGFWRRREVVLGSGETVPLGVRLEPAPRLARRVVAADGRAVSGADVHLSFANEVPFTVGHGPVVDTPCARGTTDAEGRFDLPLSRPDLVLTVQDSGHGPFRMPAADAPDPIVLPPACVVSGRLVDAAGGGLARVRVALQPRGVASSLLVLRARTEEDGAFRIPGAAVGAWALHVPDLRGMTILEVPVAVAPGGTALGPVVLPGR